MELTKPLGYYTDNTALRFHMLDVGEGLMILIIFPNDQVMILLTYRRIRTPHIWKQLNILIQTLP